MADPIRIPDEILRRSQADPAQVEHAAGWASHFSTTNDTQTQRAGYEQDLATYAQQLLVSRQAAQAANLQASAGARAVAAAAAKAEIDAANQQRLNELHPLKMEALRMKTQADASLQQRQISEETRKNLIASHENGLIAGHNDFLTANPDATQAEKDSNIVALGRQFPHAKNGTNMVGTLITEAARGEAARQREAEKAAALQARNTMAAAEAKALGLDTHQITASGAHTYDRGGSGPAMTPEQKVALHKQAMVNGALSFGHLGSDGKIEPDATGGTATHVSSFYQNPTTGEMHRTPPMTIDEFKKFQGAITMSPPATTVPATIWKADANGNKFEYDAATKKPTGKYVKGG